MSENANQLAANQLEPSSLIGNYLEDDQQLFLSASLSQAISLKRIADFVCGTDTNCDIVGYIGDEFRPK